MAVPSLPVDPGRRVSAPVRGQGSSNIATDLAAIVAGDNDLFVFDMSPWFPSGVTTMSLFSHPPGWLFTDMQIEGALIYAYGLAPLQAADFILCCTASDGSPTVLTSEAHIQVIP